MNASREAKGAKRGVRYKIRGSKERSIYGNKRTFGRAAQEKEEEKEP